MKYDKEWFKNLEKPWFQPPAWLFRPVWAVLYTLMFVALFFAIRNCIKLKLIVAIFLFVVQLVVNLSWSPIFFIKKNLKKALYISALLAVLVFVTMVYFSSLSIIAGILFLPYFLWCLFALVLCYYIFKLNKM